MRAREGRRGELWSDPDPSVRRLRPLSEQECYARCYGWRSEDTVRIVKVVPRRRDYEPVTGEWVRARLDERLGSRAPEAA